MAYYNYKLVRDRVPDWLTDCIVGYEGSCDYDGDLWCAAAAYIDFLEERIKLLGGDLDPTLSDKDAVKAI